jgi:hypothetical protein
MVAVSTNLLTSVPVASGCPPDPGSGPRQPAPSSPTAGQLGEVTFDSPQATIKAGEAATARLAAADGDITARSL